MSEWISVKDRLPNDVASGLDSDKVDVWCRADNCRLTDVTFLKGEFLVVVLEDGYYSHYLELENITHWMPLPEPPKAGDV
ncbi:MAG: hypothetical protein ACI9RI_000877 [Oceanospirillaceae bacterium]|jgi:hypothetical protein